LPDPTAERARGVRHVQIGEAAGQRIDNYLLGELGGVPRSRVYGMLRKGEVRINGGRVKPDYRLSAGDVVRIPPWHGPAAGEPTLPSRGVLERLASRIIYQDANLIVIDKPAGTAVHGGSGIEHGIIEAFRALLPEERNLDRVRPFPEQLRDLPRRQIGAEAKRDQPTIAFAEQRDGRVEVQPARDLLRELTAACDLVEFHGRRRPPREPVVRAAPGDRDQPRDRRPLPGVVARAVLHGALERFHPL